MAGPTKTADRQGRASGHPPRPARASRTPGTPGAPSTRRARFRSRLPGRRTVVILLALALLLGGFGAWALYGSNWLRVEHVSVSGARVLTEEQVRETADVRLGSPLASVDKDAVERRLRRGLRRIDSVEVVRSWPHGVGLKVTERKTAAVQKEAGEYVEVDSEGVRFATVDKRPEGVPLLDMEARQSAGLRHFGADRLRRAAVRVATSVPESVAPHLRSVRVRSYDSITLVLTQGRTVRWGSSARGAAKAKSLTALMKAAGDAGHFDVSVPSAPAAERS
ncbi:FtsQ-type POTRA domain-containing protein [Streptomyces sp. N2-109]|uniref:Cell division protein FtsQ n=1 Tax=Streptomyces gossypii TaxID=2883101 RepID=A0ABT2JZP7_9ACTN|nr:FtsQ-type POTRA domain-containing protein [Streptomyces gossypii]MCT2593384.1 FtsQ-type POTRA domain-containing protein [Streptomyces gossypii]